MISTKKIRSSVVALTTATILSSSLIWSSSASASEPFLGEIKMFGGNFAPRGFAFCGGQLLSIASNSALFSILGTTYGGDGRTNFGLPDLRGRVAIHSGSGTGPGLSRYNLGRKGGAERVALTALQMPSHTHTIGTTATATATATATVKGTNATGDSETPGGNSHAKKSRTKQYSTAAPDVAMHADSVSVDVVVDSVDVTATAANTGGSLAHPNIQPFLGINYIIATVGIFPSRN